MNFLKYIFLTVILLFGMTARADYNPTNPPEPGQMYRINTGVSPRGAGSVVSSMQNVTPGTSIYIYTSPASGYTFLNWTDEEGTVVNTRSSFSMTMPEHDVTLIANYTYNPTSPAEPTPPEVVSYGNINIRISPADGGSASGAGRYQYGSRPTLYARANTGFVFKGWALEGNIVSSSTYFYPTVDSPSTDYVALFEYAPTNPAEPDAPVSKHKVFATAEPAGCCVASPTYGSAYADGTNVYISVSSIKSGYQFRNWTNEAGEVVATSTGFYYPLNGADVHLTAHLEYSPSNPAEPGAPAENRNVVYGGKVTAIPAMTYYYPIYLSNIDRMNGITFDITIPEGMTADFNAIRLTDRAPSHSISFSDVGLNTTRVALQGAAAIQGASGLLMEIPITPAFSSTKGDLINIGIEKGVAILESGQQTPMDAISGIIRISDDPALVPDSPDFVVSDVTAQSATLIPGEAVSLSWKVSNEGNIDASDGWSETISLVSDAGVRTQLGTLYYTGQPLKIGESASRQATLAIPAIPGIDGELNLLVAIYPYAPNNEAAHLKANNTALTTDHPITLGKTLQLSLPEILSESTDRSARGMITRTGTRTAAQSFTLTLSPADERISLPQSVVIPRNQSSAYFTFSILPDGKLNDDSDFTITAAGGSYTDAAASFTLTDDTLPSISLSTEKDEIIEGESLKLHISIPRTLPTDLEIGLGCDAPTRFSIPSPILIPAGETSLDLEIPTVDNSQAEADKEVLFRAVAADYIAGELIVELADNDIPDLQLELSASAISEAEGPNALQLTLRRLDNIDKRATIRISDDSNGGLHYAQTSVEFTPGMEEAYIVMGPLDNAIVDADRTYTIEAAVYLSSCSCSVGSGAKAGIATISLEVFDDDGPTLLLTSPASAISEGSTLTATVSRNTSTANPLTVSLTSNLTSETSGMLSFPESVVIPAGSTSATFEIAAPTNAISGDGLTASITAEAPGFSKSALWLTVTDQSLPDARITLLTSPSTEAEAEADFPLSVTLTNTGATPLPPHARIDIMLGGSAPAGSLYSTVELNPGESETISGTVILPASVGNCEIYAIVNRERLSPELNYSNNSSSPLLITLTSPFSTTLSAERATYAIGETVKISGHAAGSRVPEQLDLYVINEGYRHLIPVEVGADGSFSVDYTPYQTQIGHFSLGACYPGDATTLEQASFEIPALRRVDSQATTYEGLAGETLTGYLTVENPSQIPLTSIIAEAATPEELTLSLQLPTVIEPGQRTTIKFNIDCDSPTAGNEWITIPLSISSAEGAKFSTNLFYYCYNPQGALQASAASISTTMILGATREYPLQLRNGGKGATGKITPALPSWMKLSGAQEIASLEPGEELTVSLLFTPTPDMAMNIPVGGQLAFNCANGEGVVIPFSIEPVSEAEGTLTIEVSDEFTYYTAEAPHLAGAQVSIKHPTRGTVVASGTTDESGRFTATLPEGYYAVAVTADKHDSYSNNIIIDPGREKIVNIDLSYQPITVNWNVVETEVEDQYSIVTTVQYETNVPAPMVVLDGPESIDGDSMLPGESVVVNYVLTNYGLIKAFDVEFLTGADTSEWQFEKLISDDLFDLAPQQSMVVPVKITRREPSAGMRSLGETVVGTLDNCMTQMADKYRTLCGKTWKDNTGARALALKACGGAAFMGGVMEVLSYLTNLAPGLVIKLPYPVPNPNGTPQQNYRPRDDQNIPGSTNGGICDPDIANCGNNLVDGLLGLANGAGATAMGAAAAAANAAAGDGVGSNMGNYGDGGDGGDGSEFFANRRQPIFRLSAGAAAGAAANAVGGPAADATLTGIGGLTGHPHLADGASKALGLGQLGGSIVSCYQATNGGGNQAPAKIMRAAAPLSQYEWIDNFLETMERVSNQYIALDKIICGYFGDPVFVDEYDASMKLLLDSISAAAPPYRYDDFASLRPAAVASTQLQRFLDRLNNTQEGITEDGNYIDYAAMREGANTILDIEEEAVAKGYPSMNDWFNATNDIYRTNLAEMSSSSSVCASITLQFSQTMTMTRQAFRGTLSVFNGHESLPMTDVRLNLIITDEEGNQATTHEFQTNVESLDGFSGEAELGTAWGLDAAATGSASILFIPTRYAAPEVERAYSFGGELQYVDPFTGLEVTRSLAPVTLTVKPSPTLDLTYFMQRDVFGDDPFTNEIEPMREAEFALLINNVGYGDATNVALSTAQPEIIENEKGLYIDFELLSSQLNGAEKTLALGGSVATDFGDIPARSQAFAQWMFTSSLTGHFTSYKVEATHVTSYDNPDLSLLGDVAVHELIYSLDAGTRSDGLPLKGFLVNDLPDAEDLPDNIYLSNGDIESVAQASAASLRQMADRTWQLDVQPGTEGWFYGYIADPTFGRMELESVSRLDGTPVSLNAFRQTDRTMRDGMDPQTDYRLHFADLAGQGASTVSYLLTFAEAPATLLDVMQFIGIPEGTAVTTEPLRTIGVRFNKAIDPDTFTTDDLTLHIQGEKVAPDNLQITPADAENSTFNISLGDIESLSGLYTLTVLTEAITDSEGFSGRNGRAASWVYLHDGNPKVVVSISPEEAGSITRSAEDPTYGETLTLTAQPAPGFEFAGWLEKGESISTENALDVIIATDRALTALFTPVLRKVVAEENEGGGIDFPDGFYDHGTTITLTATPDEDYRFVGWNINGQPAEETDPTLTLTIDRDMEIEALFVREYYRQNLPLSRGWNWMASYLREAPELSTSGANIEQILTPAGEAEASQSDQATYKVLTSMPTLVQNRGHLREIPTLEVAAGINWLPSVAAESTELTQYIANPQEGDALIALTGFAQYAAGAWHGTLAEVEPGEFHLYSTDSAHTLSFASAIAPAAYRDAEIATHAFRDAGIATYADAEESNLINSRAYPDMMAIIATPVSEEADLSYDAADLRIYALAGNEFRGISSFIDGKHYLSVHGNTDDDIRFIVVAKGSDVEYEVTDHLKFRESLMGSVAAPMEIRFKSKSLSVETIPAAGAEGEDILLTICTPSGLLLYKDAPMSVLRLLEPGIYIINGRTYAIR